MTYLAGEQAAEIAEVLGADRVVLARLGPGDEMTVMAHRGADTPHLLERQL